MTPDAKPPRTRHIEIESDNDSKQEAATPTARAAAERWLGDLYRRPEALRADG
jgi:hypothetical protein